MLSRLVISLIFLSGPAYAFYQPLCIPDDPQQSILACEYPDYQCCPGFHRFVNRDKAYLDNACSLVLSDHARIWIKSSKHEHSSCFP